MTMAMAMAGARCSSTASTPATSRRRCGDGWYPGKRTGSESGCRHLLIASALLLLVVTNTSPPFAVDAAAGASSEPQPPLPSQQQQNSPYTSITALDRYGNSAQLRNALLASTRQSPSLVVACLASGDGGRGDGDDDSSGRTRRVELDSVVICSSHRPRPGVASPRYWGDATAGGAGAVSAASSSSAGRAVHVVASDDHSSDDDDGDGSDGLEAGGGRRAITGVAFSGVRADARLLLSILREHARRSWERYDVVPGAGSTSRALGEVLLTFMGYRRDRELHDGAGPVAPPPDDDGEEGGEGAFDMARPFGVQSLVVGIASDADDGRNAGGGQAEIFAVDPSGVTEACFARAIGRGSDEANKLLERRWRGGMTIHEAAEMCGGIVREVVAGTTTSDGGAGPSADVTDDRSAKWGGYAGDSSSDGEGEGRASAIVCEVLCPRRGLTVMSRSPLRSGDEEGGQKDDRAQSAHR